MQCVKVEPDIDYFQDLAAHAMLEVIPNTITHDLTDPKKVYVLRWIAGKHAGIPGRVRTGMLLDSLSESL